MHVYFIGTKYDYDRYGNITKRVHSHDYSVWYESLCKLENPRLQVTPFWFTEVMRERGKKKMNAELIQAIKRDQPNIAIFAVGEDEIERRTMAHVTEGLRVKTIYIAGDDGWRFDSVSRRFAPACSLVLTSYPPTIPGYQKLGCFRVMPYAGWANTNVFHPVAGVKDIDVSFVGTWSPTRAEIVNRLQRAGIEVVARGKGWAAGEIAESEMAQFISRSKISLGLIGSSFYFGIRPLARLFFRRPPAGSRSRRYLFDGHHFFSNIREWFQKKRPQIKGRVFEIPACRTMQLAEYAEGLDCYYQPGSEIVLFRGIDDLIEKVRYYSAHNEERERIAQAGYRRTMEDHTPEKRLGRIFEEIKKL